MRLPGDELVLVLSVTVHSPTCDLGCRLAEPEGLLFPALQGPTRKAATVWNFSPTHQKVLEVVELVKAQNERPVQGSSY